jgi:hypothetical protein
VTNTEYAELADTLDAWDKWELGCGRPVPAKLNHAHTASVIRTLLAREERLRKALAGIAKQRLWDEMSEEDQENADWTEGYEECVRRARAALGGEPS